MKLDESKISIGIILGILLVSIFLYSGFSYINKIYTQPNLARIISVYKGLPFPDKPGSDTMEIRGKIISRYIAVDKNTEWTTDDWKDFVNHMIRDGWTVEDKFMVHEDTGTVLYTTFTKRDDIVDSSHVEGSQRWHFLVIYNNCLFQEGI